jgi:hypothetical protein
MDDFGNGGPHEQHNHGSGPFIGRDNYGDIRYEMVDPKTKTALAKLSKDAPDLAKLLRKALRDGVISPESVAALESAVRNINEDVADSLRLAGQNINEDVADSLRFAGQNINEDVANKILGAANTLDEVKCGLNYALSSLDTTVGKLNGGSGVGHLVGVAGAITAAAERIERVVTPPPPMTVVNWKATYKACFWVFVVGILAGAILIYYLIKR